MMKRWIMARIVIEVSFYLWGAFIRGERKGKSYLSRIGTVWEAKRAFAITEFGIWI